uniref:Uncharacterized protein n=1 Tax=Ditylenchus dipsaci TaxID=166011 RepID=A0A915ENB9_9BILA
MQQDLQLKTDNVRPEFDRLVELYSEIVKLVSLEDSNELEATVRNLTSKYNDVGTRCHNCGQLLANLAEGITSFLHNTTALAEWLDQAEQDIEQFQQVSVQPEELIEQSEKLTELVISVAEQGALVSQVVEDSRELCNHTSGSEAIALQYRIDQLRNRYSQLAVEAENKIAVLTKAIPLSEEVKEGFAELEEFLNGVEEDLDNLDQVPLEEQFQVVNTIEGDIAQYRTQMDSLQEMCIDLQRLSCDSKANELGKESAQIMQRFNATADMVSRKAEQLKSAERQSRQTFDILDFWIDWFVETKDNILQADKPSVDMECLKAQLKHQRVLNDEIATEKAGLRDVISEASKLARDLSSTKAKKLAEETSELGLERTAELEQSFALCKELDDSYTELNEWMDNVEQELCSCEPITTGIDPKALIEQQTHNNNMLQAIQAQRQ